MQFARRHSSTVRGGTNNTTEGTSQDNTLQYIVLRGPSNGKSGILYDLFSEDYSTFSTLWNIANSTYPIHSTSWNTGHFHYPSIEKLKKLNTNTLTMKESS